MSPKVEAKMSRLKQLWARIVGIAKALEGIDDPIGDSMFSLEKRVRQLECKLEDLQRQLLSRSGGSDVQQ